MKVIKVGTRKSKLAMTQTQQLVDQLKELHPERDFVLVPYTTKGDRLTHVSLQEIGGKGSLSRKLSEPSWLVRLIWRSTVSRTCRLN